MGGLVVRERLRPGSAGYVDHTARVGVAAPAARATAHSGFVKWRRSGAHARLADEIALAVLARLEDDAARKQLGADRSEVEVFVAVGLPGGRFEVAEPHSFGTQ